MAIPSTCILKFGASWCGPCKAIQPFVDKLATEEGATLVNVDVDSDQLDLATKYDVAALPTIVFLVNKNEVGRVVGADRNKVSEAMDKFKKYKDKSQERVGNQFYLPTTKDATIR